MTLLPALFFAALLASATLAHADDVIVVTANRLETPADKLASSSSVIGREQIERSGKQSVTELLRDVPGVTIEAGNPGAVPSIFLRGIDSGHVLVLVDGIKINDPTQPSGGFDLSSLNPDEIERIEIVRGAQSVMYGSNAIGGVINIVTRKGGGARRFSGEAEYGSYQTYRTQLAARGEDLGVRYSLNAELKGAEGFSSADAALGNTEKDGFSSMSFATRLSGEPAEKFQLDGSIHYTFKKSDLDLGGGAPRATGANGPYDIGGGDDPNNHSEERKLLAHLEFKSKRSTLWEPIVGLSYILNNKRFDDEADALHTGSSHNTYDSSRVRADWQNNFYLNDTNTVTLGLGSELEKASFTENDSSLGTYTASDKSDWSGSAFVQHQYQSDTFFTAIGGRVDHYERFGTVLTFREAPGVQIPGTGLTLKGSFGTGFKAPTLYQLYSSYGSESLHAETSKSYDLGFEQRLFQNHVSLAATWFMNQLKDELGFVGGKYANVAQSSSHGAEFELKLRPTQTLHSRASYTYTLAKNDLTEEPLLRRPKHQLSCEAGYEFAPDSNVLVTWRYFGARTDTDAVTFGSKDMPSYSTLGISGGYLLGKGFKIFGRIDNLLDAQYEEQDGFGTAGRSFFAGLRKEL